MGTSAAYGVGQREMINIGRNNDGLGILYYSNAKSNENRIVDIIELLKVRIDLS